MGNVKRKLRKYLNGDISFSEFYQWLAVTFWNDRNDLASAIKLRIYEYSNGHWSWEELNERLKEILNKN